jgi:hypothetical protein
LLHCNDCGGEHIKIVIGNATVAVEVIHYPVPVRIDDQIGGDPVHVPRIFGRRGPALFNLAVVRRRPKSTKYLNMRDRHAARLKGVSNHLEFVEKPLVHQRILGPPDLAPRDKVGKSEMPTERQTGVLRPHFNQPSRSRGIVQVVATGHHVGSRFKQARHHLYVWSTHRDDHRREAVEVIE